MKQLYINPEKNTVHIQDGGYDPYKWDYKVIYYNSIDFALGDILHDLETQFPPSQYFENPTQYVVNSIWGNKQAAIIAGISVKASFTTSIYEWFKGKKEIALTFEDLVNLRLSLGVKGVEYQPVSGNNGSIYQFPVNLIRDVIYALLYYYAYNNIKLKKCEHCGKWFATDTFKMKYCCRKSPIEQYSHLQCRQAAERYKKKLRDRETAIYDNWKRNLTKYGDQVDELRTTCNEYLDILSVENLQALDRYLYADNMPKQTRPNRKKKQTGGKDNG